MSRLVESLQLKNGVLQNTDYHNTRMKHSRRDLFQLDENIDLKEEITIPAEFRSGLFKCRVVYTRNIDTVEFIPYEIKQIRSLKIVHGEIDYSFKFEDRSSIKNLFAERGNCDDIIILKDGMLSDTSSANIVLLREGRWYTPSTPLLKGTKRQKLLDDGIIFEEEISADDISHFSQASLINAMLDIGDIIIGTEGISMN